MLLLFIAFLWSTPDQPVEAVSLLGEQLHRPTFSARTTALFEEKLAAARTDFQRDPGVVEHHIWLGRRQAYLGRYREAIETYTKALEKFPQEPRLYRHRGHRYITLRRFDDAIADFEKAAALVKGKPDQVEPDGLPNAAGIPTSTLQTNIWYHLGLAHYLKGNFGKALDCYQRCRELSKNNDMLIATLDWEYMTLRKLNRDQEAAALLKLVSKDMDLLESFDYHKRLLLYKGELSTDALMGSEQGGDPDLAYATQGYGLGNYHLYNKRTGEALAIFRKVLTGKHWSAFGYIAAEAELSRIRR